MQEGDETPKMKKQNKKLQALDNKNVTLRNILQGLIFSSSINWAKDEHLSSLVQSLSQPPYAEDDEDDVVF